MKEKDDKRLWRRGQQRDWTKPSVDQQAGVKMVDKHPQTMSFVCVFSLASCMSLAPISSFYLHNRKPRCGSEPNLCHWTPTRKIRPTWWRFLLSERIALSVENPLQPQKLNNRKKKTLFIEYPVIMALDSFAVKSGEMSRRRRVLPSLLTNLFITAMWQGQESKTEKQTRET